MTHWVDRSLVLRIDDCAIIFCCIWKIVCTRKTSEIGSLDESIINEVSTTTLDQIKEFVILVVFNDFGCMVSNDPRINDRRSNKSVIYINVEIGRRLVIAVCSSIVSVGESEQISTSRRIDCCTFDQLTEDGYVTRSIPVRNECNSCRSTDL